MEFPPRPFAMLVNKPIIGRPLYLSLTGTVARNTNMITVKCRPSPFFFAGRTFSGITTFWAGAAMRHHRGMADAITSTDTPVPTDKVAKRRDGSRVLVSAAGTPIAEGEELTEDGADGRESTPTDTALRQREQDALYNAGFGFEHHWEGLARGIAVVGLSPIHGRGLIALEDIRKGTLVIALRQRSFVDATTFARFSGDSIVKAAAMMHYAHHVGPAMELPLTPGPQHMLNHCCDANLRCGFRYVAGRDRTERVIRSGTDTRGELVMRFASESGADAEAAVDYNGIVAARDIREGEELTLDYARRVAPAYPGELSEEQFGATPCNCGVPSCRGFVQAHATKWGFYKSDTERRAAAAKLFGHPADAADDFHDDEIVRLSLLRRRLPLARALNTGVSAMRAGKNTLQVNLDTTIGFLNSIKAERSIRGAEGDASSAVASTAAAASPTMA